MKTKREKRFANAALVIYCLAYLALVGCDAADAVADVAESTAGVTTAAPPARPAVDCNSDRSRITVRSGVHEIDTPALNADRPELSADGRRLVYTIEEVTPLPFFVLSAHEVTARRHGQWSARRLIEQGTPWVIAGTVNTWFFPTYRPDTSGLLVGLATVQTDATGIPDFASLRASFVNIAESGQIIDTVLSALDVGLPFGEIPESERYAPDGRHIAFFAQQSPADQGVYLYDVPTRTLTRLTTQLDKDPMFSSDGRTIYFHHEIDDAATGLPASYTLGALSLRSSGGPASWARALLPAAPGLSTFEQHPVPIVGSDVLWFYAQASGDPTSPSVLAARRTCAAGRVEIGIEVDGRPIVDAKRPGAALYTRDVTFMGKFEGDVNYRIFAIDDDIVDGVTDLIEHTSCPRSVP